MWWQTRHTARRIERATDKAAWQQLGVGEDAQSLPGVHRIPTDSRANEKRREVTPILKAPPRDTMGWPWWQIKAVHGP